MNGSFRSKSYSVPFILTAAPGCDGATLFSVVDAIVKLVHDVSHSIFSTGAGVVTLKWTGGWNLPKRETEQ